MLTIWPTKFHQGRSETQTCANCYCDCEPHGATSGPLPSRCFSRLISEFRPMTFFSHMPYNGPMGGVRLGLCSLWSSSDLLQSSVFLPDGLMSFLIQTRPSLLGTLSLEIWHLFLIRSSLIGDTTSLYWRYSLFISSLFFIYLLFISIT